MRLMPARLQDLQKSRRFCSGESNWVNCGEPLVGLDQGSCSSETLEKFTLPACCCFNCPCDWGRNKEYSSLLSNNGVGER